VTTGSLKFVSNRTSVENVINMQKETDSCVQF